MVDLCGKQLTLIVKIWYYIIGNLVISENQGKNILYEKEYILKSSSVDVKNNIVSILWFFIPFYRKKVQKSDRMFENVLIFASFK